MQTLRARALGAALLVALAPVAGSPRTGGPPGFPGAGAETPAKAAGARRPPIRYRYRVHPERSRVSFTFRGVILPFDAHFAVLEGEVVLGGRDPFRGAEAHLRIEAGSVRADTEARLRMLRGQVLEARSHPRIDLRVDEARALSSEKGRGRERSWEVQARGTLTLHGVEREIPLRFRMADTGVDLYIRGRGTLRLSDYGMSRPTVLMVVPGQDAVEVNVRLVASPIPPGEKP